MSQLYVTQISPVLPGGTINFTGGTAPTYNGAPFAGGGGGGGSGPTSGYEDPRVIRSTPPAVSNFVASGAFKSVILTWDLENYINHAYVEIWRATVNNRATSATLIGKSTANIYNDPGVVVGTTYYYWLRAINIEAVSGVWSTGDTAGVSAGLLQIGTTDLGSLVVDAGNLASGAVTAGKLAANAISSFTQFASGIEPISVVSSLPNPSGYTGAKVVLLTTDGKMYRYVSGAWTAGVAAPDLTGTVGNSQISALDAAKLTGTLDVARIATAALDATKFASSIEPITIVSSVPGSKSTNSIFNTTDKKLYRWNGTTYISTVAATDVANGLTSAQIADLDAAKLTGTLNVSRIASGALDATKFANTIEPITLVTSVPGTKSTNTIFNTVTNKVLKWNGSAYVGAVDAADLVGTISNSQIADGTIASTKFASSIEPITVVGSLPGTKSTNVIFNTFDGKMYRWDTGTSAYISSIPGSDVIGSVSTTSIADGSITSTKFASGIEPIGVVSSIPGSKTLYSLFNTADGKIYRWNGSAYSVALAAADITVGTITTTQITDGAITTPKMTAGSINANVLSAGTVTTNLMTANSISGDRITAASLDAGKLVAASITATQIAAGGITGDRIAAGSVTADRIQANSLTTTQIAAGGITGDRIATNSLDAGKITSGTLNSVQIQAGGITGDRIAAGTVTADRIQTNSLTSTQIAAGSIAGDRLVANTITAGKIQAGAIGATQIAANAITTDKLFVTGRGSVINDDPNTSDISAWEIIQGSASLVIDTTSPSGTSVLEIPSFQGGLRSRKVPVDATKNYNARISIKQQSGSSTSFLFVSFQNSSGTEIGGTGNGTGWPALGNFFYFGLAGNYPSSTYTEYQISFGPGELANIPTGAKTMAIGLYANYAGSGVQRVTNLRLEQKADSDLIVDGAITTQKMTANSINGDRILANTLAASKITAGTITTDRFTANSIGGTILQDGTITASKLVADSITSGQIATGAITASEVAAGAITTNKLLVTSQGSALNADPDTSDASAWPNSGAFTIVTDTTVPSGTTAIEISVTQGSIGSSLIPIDPNRNYNLRMSAKQQTGTTGAFLFVSFSTAGGTNIDGTTGVGWPGAGTYNYFGLVNNVPPSTWTEYQISFGPDETAKIPANARYAFVGMLNNYSGGAGTQRLNNVRLVEKASANLIVDGAITTQKMTANSINGDRIAANTLNASKIVANSITAGQIAAGAISATQIAAGAISVQKLLVAPVSICPDPFFQDWAWWTAFIYNSPGWFYEADSSGTAIGVPGKVTLNQSTFSASTRAHLWSGKVTSPPVGATLRLRGIIYNGSNQSVFIQALFYDATDSPIFGLILTSNAGTGTQTLTNQMVVPSGATSIRFIIYNQAGTNYTGVCHASGILLDIAGSSDMIVDGAITATKLAANSLAVGTAAIQDGAIINAMIANATIDSAKIANLNAAKITAGTLDVSRIAATSINTDKLVVGSVTNSATGIITLTGVNFSGSSSSLIFTTPVIVSFTTTGRPLLVTGSTDILIQIHTSGGTPPDHIRMYVKQLVNASELTKFISGNKFSGDSSGYLTTVSVAFPQYIANSAVGSTGIGYYVEVYIHAVDGTLITPTNNSTVILSVATTALEVKV